MAGNERPLGVTCLEDKIAQQAWVLILQEIYEPELLGTAWTSGPINGAYPARGEVHFVRYADDVVACFQYRGEGSGSGGS